MPWTDTTLTINDTAMDNSEHQNVLFTLAENIKWQRKRIGLSQEELAFKANIDRTFVSKIERGNANPSLKTLLAIANVLDVPFIQLLTSEEKVNHG